MPASPHRDGDGQFYKVKLVKVRYTGCRQARDLEHHSATISSPIILRVKFGHDKSPSFSSTFSRIQPARSLSLSLSRSLSLFRLLCHVGHVTLVAGATSLEPVDFSSASSKNAGRSLRTYTGCCAKQLHELAPLTSSHPPTTLKIAIIINTLI